MRKRQSPLANLGGKKAAICRYSLRLVVAFHELYQSVQRCSQAPDRGNLNVPNIFGPLGNHSQA